MARTDCPPGTEPIVDYHPDRTMYKLNQDACIDPKVRDQKKAIANSLKSAMNSLGYQSGQDYFAYVRVIPKSIVDSGPPADEKCSCMCGCSS
jgi:hypothetical protein